MNKSQHPSTQNVTKVGFLNRITAKILFRSVIFLLHHIYKQSDENKFSATKHKRMINLSKTAAKLFNAITFFVDDRTRFNYSVEAKYESCKILIRPFVFSEIIMVSGLWETYVRRFLFENIHKGDVIVDVGANIGIYAIPLSRKVRKVIAFEPNPICYNMLRNSTHLNQIDNLTIFENAVSESRKTISYTMAKVPMNSSVTDSNNGHIMKIDSVDLDTFLQNEDRMDWLLIDVEGYELNVLKGASKILYKYAPKIIVEIIDENVAEAREFLVQHGYRVTNLGTIYYYAAKPE